MTNEEIAVQILGGSEELCPLLWRQVEKLLHYWARRYYNANRDRFTRHGVELCDLEQELYFAFRQAIRYYKPDSGYKFTTFLRHPFLRTCRQLLGGNRKEPDPLNNCLSLDRPADPENDSEGATLGDLQADNSTADVLERMEQAAAAELIRSEVEQLPEREGSAVKYYYFDGLTLEQVGGLLDVSYQRTEQILSNARRTLRKSRELRTLYAEYYRAHTSRDCSRAFNLSTDWNPERFEQHKRAQEQEQAAAATDSPENIQQELRDLLELIHAANRGGA